MPHFSRAVGRTDAMNKFFSNRVTVPLRTVSRRPHKQQGRCLAFLLFVAAAAGFTGCQPPPAQPKSPPSARQLQFDWRGERGVTTLSFENNGRYEVRYALVGIDDVARGTNDTGRWSWERKDRILMLSDSLLPKSFVGNKAFSISLSTPISAEYNLTLLKEILTTMTNTSYGVEELRLATRRTMDSTREPPDMRSPVICVRGQGALGTRKDIQAMTAELERMRRTPDRFTVCCDLKLEGGRILLKPEKSREDTFGDFYRPGYFAVMTDAYPVLVKGDPRMPAR